MNSVDGIWHRALNAKPASRLPGDVALHAVLRVHGLVENGGVLHATESLSALGELETGLAGFEWLGLGEVAALIREAAARAEDPAIGDDGLDVLEQESNARYSALVPDDEALESALRDRIAKDPGAFAEPRATRERGPVGAVRRWLTERPR
ncbi:MULTISPECIES: hypothetical protein [unclassified Aeromicrobium]|uniref:hypothetical protein n=1 Tax=unclassified Aeromicrobium TaxID=2633570 RepID=UPI00396B2242